MHTSGLRRLSGLAWAWLGATLLCATVSNGVRVALAPATTVHAAARPSARLDHPDAECRTCHQKIYDSYELTSMARGSGLAQDGFTAEERQARGFLHESSGVRYAVLEKEGRLTLTYERPQTAERHGLHGSEDLVYFIGSGKRGRTFLFQKEDLWFEAPINWYGKKRIWDMAPAFDAATAMPDPLPVDSNCLHCHAGQVQASVGGVRNRFAGEPFLAGGIGCAGCHGDPAAHLAATTGHPGGGFGPILNPDKLVPSRRDATCLQCHLEGDAAVFRPGKSLAGFQPGQDLADSVVYFVDRNRAAEGGRASSQYEALLRSACRRAVGDKLTCTSCHDPHSSPPPAERVAFFRSRCLACHTGPVMASQHHPEQQDCATCHMPTRKTLDISHEQLTDHDIEARPRLAPIAVAHRQSPDLVPVGTSRVTIAKRVWPTRSWPSMAIALPGSELCKLLLAAQRGGSHDREMHDQLGFLLQVSGSPAAATEQYLAALKEEPGDTTAAANLAVIDAARLHIPEAVLLLEQVVRSNPSQTAAGLNLAFLQCRLDQKTGGTPHDRDHVAFQPGLHRGSSIYRVRSLQRTDL